MIKIAITGNAGSGKSTFTNKLSVLGAHVFSADSINAGLLRLSHFITKWLEVSLNRNLHKDSSLDKELLRRVVFEDESARMTTEHLLHPLIKQNIELQQAVCTNADYTVTEVPLLFEAKWEDEYDKIILIKSRRDLIISRIVSRTGLSKSMASLVIDNQNNMSRKSEHSNDILINNGTLEDILLHANNFHTMITKQFGPHTG